MTIDEAILLERETVRRNKMMLELDKLMQESHAVCFDKLKREKCIRIHEQLAEWLEELKAIKSDGFTDDLLNMGFTKGYNKAIGDFVEKAIKVVYEANNRDRNPKPRDMVADIHYKLLEIAEQLKVGGTQ